MRGVLNLALQCACDDELIDMRNKAGQTETVFQEVCVWCGAVIRLNGTKPSRGMCPKRFARMMREHTRPFQRDGNSHGASDR
jgi:hypothetical protein